MVSRDEDTIVIYPCYFDKALSRSSGRRVPLNQAVEKPNVDSLAKAARLIGESIKIEKEAKHPSSPFRSDGRILISNPSDSKQNILSKISSKL